MMGRFAGPCEAMQLSLNQGALWADQRGRVREHHFHHLQRRHDSEAEFQKVMLKLRAELVAAGLELSTVE